MIVPQDGPDLTGSADGRFGMEQPEPDALEEGRRLAAPADPELEPIGELPAEANEADVLDQHRVVPTPDDEY